MKQFRTFIHSRRFCERFAISLHRCGNELIRQTDNNELMCNIDIYPIHNDTHSIALCGTNNQQTKMHKTNILTHSRGTNDQRLFKPPDVLTFRSLQSNLALNLVQRFKYISSMKSWYNPGVPWQSSLHLLVALTEFIQTLDYVWFNDLVISRCGSDWFNPFV